MMQEIRSLMDLRDVSVMVELVDIPVLVKVIYRKDKVCQISYSPYIFSVKKSV